MAKHRFQQTRKNQATRLLLLAALVLGLGVSPSWAGQQLRSSPSPAPKTAPTTGPRMARTSRQSLAKTLAQRKRAKQLHSSALADGKRDPFKLPLEVMPAIRPALRALWIPPRAVFYRQARGDC